MVDGPEDLFQKALSSLERGDAATSQQFLNELLALNPTHAQGLMRRGFVRMRLFDFDGALQDWEQAVELETNLVRQFETTELRTAVESALDHFKTSSTADPSSAQSQVLLGRAYTVFGRYALALQAFTTASRLAPDELAAGIGAANVYSKLGQTEQALQVLQKLVEQHPNSALLCSKIGFIYLNLNSTAQAVRFLERSSTLNPADWRSHLALGEIFVRQGRHEQAMTRYQQTLQLQPTNSTALVGMAECCKELYRFEEAISYYQKAIAANPADFKALGQMGMLCIQLGGLDLGIESLLQAKELRADDGEICSNLARAYQQKGDLATAAQYYAKSVELNPKDYFAAYNLGLIYRSQGRIEEAAEAFGHAAELRANDSQYQFQLARAQLELGRLEQALEASQRAVALNPHNKEIQIIFGRTCLQAGQFAEAAESFQTAINIDPANSEAHYQLAVALLQLSRFDDARQGFQKVLSQSPNHAPSLHGIGHVLRMQGESTAALDYFLKASTLDPSLKQSVHELARIFLEAGQRERVLQTIQELLRQRPNDPRLTGPYLDGWLEAFQLLGEFDQGTQILDFFAGRFPNQAQVKKAQSSWHLYWADQFRQKGELEAAQACLERQLELHPGDMTVLQLLKELLTPPPAPDPVVEESPVFQQAIEPAGENFWGPGANQPTATPSVETEPVARPEAETALLGIRDIPAPTAHGDPQDLARRMLDFAFELEGHGWLKEAALLLEDAQLLDPVSPEPSLHRHRILSLWASRLDQEGQEKHASALRHLFGGAVAPPEDRKRVSRPLAGERSTRPLLEPPPADLPLLPPPPLETQELERFATLEAQASEPLPILHPEPVFAEPEPERTPEPAPMDRPSETAFPPAPDPVEVTPASAVDEVSPYPVEAVSLSTQEQAQDGEAVLPWMAEATTGSPWAEPTPLQATVGLGAPIGGRGESPRFFAPPETEEAAAPEPALFPPEPVVQESISSWMESFADEHPEPAAPVPPPAEPSLAPEPLAAVDEAYSSPEFEVNLTGQEDQAALINLAQRHPEHRGVRLAIYRTMGDDSAGLLKIFRELTQEDSDEPYHVLNLARAYAHTGSDSLAVLQFRKYVKLEPTSEGYRELGEVYDRMGKAELAQQSYRRAEQLAEQELAEQ